MAEQKTKYCIVLRNEEWFSGGYFRDLHAKLSHEGTFDCSTDVNRNSIWDRWYVILWSPLLYVITVDTIIPLFFKWTTNDRQIFSRVLPGYIPTSLTFHNDQLLQTSSNNLTALISLFSSPFARSFQTIQTLCLERWWRIPRRNRTLSIPPLALESSLFEKYLTWLRKT